MRILPLVCVLAIAPVALGAAQTTPKPAGTQAKSGAKGAGRTVELNAGDNMKFDVTTIEAKPGEKLHVVLKSTGTAPKIAMAHNFVLVKEGASAVEFNNA